MRPQPRCLHRLALLNGAKQPALGHGFRVLYKHRRISKPFALSFESFFLAKCIRFSSRSAVDRLWRKQP
ncbi:protein of unknown function [Thauera humireducens]|nr:protein of unknown function [Thauera humireducens]CAH1749527.1 protein of unknown function [Thauera humireducens]